jgi:hypothetical protein
MHLDPNTLYALVFLFLTLLQWGYVWFTAKTSSQQDAQRKAEEEAKRKAEEEEGIRKAAEEEETIRISAEEEAKRKAAAEEEAKRKAEEAAGGSTWKFLFIVGVPLLIVIGLFWWAQPIDIIEEGSESHFDYPLMAQAGGSRKASVTIPQPAPSATNYSPEYLGPRIGPGGKWTADKRLRITGTGRVQSQIAAWESRSRVK